MTKQMWLAYQKKLETFAAPKRTPPSPVSPVSAVQATNVCHQGRIKGGWGDMGVRTPLIDLILWYFTKL
jgi:hypothetical protein